MHSIANEAAQLQKGGFYDLKCNKVMIDNDIHGMRWLNISILVMPACTAIAYWLKWPCRPNMLENWGAVVAQRLRPLTSIPEVPGSNPSLAVAPLGKALYPHCLVFRRRLSAVGPVYRRVINYARKRTHFTSRKEQGEIPVKWSDSRNRQLYLGGETYGSQLLS